MEAVEAHERFEPGSCRRRVCSHLAGKVPAFEQTSGSDARPFGHARAAEWRFVPSVRRSAGRAVLDPPRRSGSGTDPPVFYGGKAGKSLTAIPIMASVARDWKLQTEFASC